MAEKKTDSTAALVVVVKALENLSVEDRQWVLQSAASRWNTNYNITANMGGFAVSANAVTGVQNANHVVPAKSAAEMQNVRAFIRAKNPKTDVQRVACLVYYLTQTTGQLGFSSKDINQAHVDSGGSKINMTRALDNATRQSKYISSRGSNEKQLTTLGEDVVAALPDQAAVRAVEVAMKSRGKVRKKKKGKKKA